MYVCVATIKYIIICRQYTVKLPKVPINHSFNLPGAYPVWRALIAA